MMFVGVPRSGVKELRKEISECFGESDRPRPWPAVMRRDSDNEIHVVSSNINWGRLVLECLRLFQFPIDITFSIFVNPGVIYIRALRRHDCGKVGEKKKA